MTNTALLRAAQLRTQEKYPNKRQARIMLGNAVRDGRVQRQPCVDCGNPKAEAHHDDYAEPLAVLWLCTIHHSKRHRGRVDRIVVNPGEILQEALADRHLSQAGAARLMGVSTPYVNNLCQGKSAYGPATALKLEALTDITAEFWASLWARYAVAVERQRLSDVPGYS